MSKSKEEQLLLAAAFGELEKVKSLCGDPDLNINWQYGGGFTSLSIACHGRHVGVVKYLLSLKGIDPNKPANKGSTPLFMACANGHKEVVSLLLADPRIDPNKPKNDQSTPLWYASQNGHLVVVRHLLASGREIDTKMKSTFNNKTAFEHGKAMGIRKKDQDIAPVGKSETEDEYKLSKLNGPLCADLIDAHEKDPATVSSQLRKQLGPRGISSHSPFPVVFKITRCLFG